MYFVAIVYVCMYACMYVRFVSFTIEVGGGVNKIEDRLIGLYQLISLFSVQQCTKRKEKYV